MKIRKSRQCFVVLLLVSAMICGMLTGCGEKKLPTFAGGEVVDSTLYVDKVEGEGMDTITFTKEEILELLGGN